jgi:putative ABC transport system permease protein
VSSGRSPAGDGPSRLALWMLRRTLPPGAEGDSVIGDLLQELHESRGTRAARWRFRLHACSIALRYLPARLVKRHAVHHATHSIERPKMGIDGVAQDLRFAARTLVKHRGFSFIVVATIALGIGAATAIFSVVEAILIRPLPFAAPDRLVVVNETNNGRMTLAWPNYLDFRTRSHSYESLACHQANAFTVVEIGRPRRFDGRLVCWNFFDVLGVTPQLGRTFTAADDHAGASPVAMLGDRFWRQDLGADPSVIGRPIRTSERTLTIVGVLPAGFQLSRPEDIFVPLGLTVTPDAGWLDRGNHFGLFAIGRLKPGITLQQARDEAERIASDLQREYPNSNSGNGAEVSPLGERIVEPVESTLTALMGAVGFLLLLA